jgi:hypothetical protein
MNLKRCSFKKLLLLFSGNITTVSNNQHNFIRRKRIMAILANKKVIAIGDRDGVPGPAIEECVKTAGGEIVFSSTECFV